jgi:CO/xanthine dehydrogenase FAD-binding subunit
MHAIEYHKATSLADAVAVLAKSGGRPLAGGQSLVPAMKLRLAQPGTLVDLSGIAELRGVRREGTAVVIGALTRHAEVAASADVKAAIPALAADELVTAVSFPVPAKAAYAKFANPASRFALVGVFVAQLADGSVRVAVTGAAPSVYRCAPLEAALSKRFTADAAKAVKVDASGLNGDLHASAEYRAHLIPVMAARAVAAAARGVL